MTDELFTTRMKKETRKLHALSDALFNAKLIFALAYNDVWADGLLIFYEIFKFLEYAMKEREQENLGKLYIEELNRTSAFEKDISFYLGENWKETYEVRESVKNYLDHLKVLLKTDSDLLMVYVYHLYMGLLSGGQILGKKKQFQEKLLPGGKESPEAVIEFEGVTISDLKSRLRDKMNEIAETLDKKKKALLVEESRKVFELNNSIIKTIKETDGVATKNFSLFLSCLCLILAIIFYCVCSIPVRI